MNVGVQMYVWHTDLIFFGYIYPSWHNGSIFNFLKNFHTDLHNLCLLSSFHQCIRIHFSPDPHQNLLFLVLVAAFLTRWDISLISDFIYISLMIDDVEDIFTYFWPLVGLLLRNTCWACCPLLSWVSWVFCYWAFGVYIGGCYFLFVQQ